MNDPFSGFLSWKDNVQDLWSRLQTTHKPVYLYGMGNGADRIAEACASYGVPIAGCFASDSFVRGQSFRGMPVQKLSQIEACQQDFWILVSFAVHDQPTMDRIYQLSQRYELAAPDVPVAGGGLFNCGYFRNHLSELADAFALLADDLSRRVFSDILLFKLTGKVELLRHCATQRQEVYQSLLSVRGQECYCDLGAYDGDTIRELLSYTNGQVCRIFAIEPDPQNFRKLSRYYASLPQELAEKTTLWNLAAWEREETVAFDRRSGRSSAVQTAGRTVICADALDHLIPPEQPITLLKLDVEGAEEKVLKGCQKLLNRYHPRLMLSAYHRNSDLFRLPLLLEKLCPGYRFYLRHHPYIPAWETNLYGIWTDI